MESLPQGLLFPAVHRCYCMASFSSREPYLQQRIGELTHLSSTSGLASEKDYYHLCRFFALFQKRKLISREGEAGPASRLRRPAAPLLPAQGPPHPPVRQALRLFPFPPAVFVTPAFHTIPPLLHRRRIRVILFQYGFAARERSSHFQRPQLLPGRSSGLPPRFGSMDCPEAKGILVVRIGTDQSDFGAGCQRKRFFPVFQKYHALHGSFLCQPAVFLTQEQPGFLRFICSPVGSSNSPSLFFSFRIRITALSSCFSSILPS